MSELPTTSPSARAPKMIKYGTLLLPTPNGAPVSIGSEHEEWKEIGACPAELTTVSMHHLQTASVGWPGEIATGTATRASHARDARREARASCASGSPGRTTAP